MRASQAVISDQAKAVAIGRAAPFAAARPTSLGREFTPEGTGSGGVAWSLVDGRSIDLAMSIGPASDSAASPSRPDKAKARQTAVPTGIVAPAELAGPTFEHGKGAA